MTKPLKRWGPGKQRPVPVLTSFEAYRSWAETYPARAQTALLRAEEQAVRSLLPDLAGRIVLDLACGTGRWGLYAQEQGAARVIGLDESAAMLGRCPLAERELASLEAIPLRSGSVDVVIGGLAAGHLPFLRDPLRESARVLRPGGVAVFSDLHPVQAFSGAPLTFTDAANATWAVEHFVHLLSEWFEAGDAVGWRLTGLREPGLREGEAAGNQGDVPAVLAVRFERAD